MSGDPAAGDPGRPRPAETDMSALGMLLYVSILLALFFAFGSSTIAVRAYLHRDRDAETELLLSPIGKTEYFQRHADEADLIFFGDSRTHIGVDPDPTTEATGLRAFNCGSTAHWFPTQYPQLRRMAPRLRGKTVVWLIGEINFRGLQGTDDQMNRNFYLSPGEFIEYWWLGFNPAHLVDNLLLSFVSNDFVAFAKDAVQARIQRWLEAPVLELGGAAGAKPPPASPALSKHQAQVMARAQAIFTDGFEERFEDGREAKNVLYSIRRRSGQAAYFEVDSPYLRAQQQKLAAKISPSAEPIVADPRQLAIFERMLATFEESGARLVVVDYLDAPFHYRFPENRHARDEFMKGIEARVRAHGFAFIRPDMSALRDEDYFDYNHLNYEGSRQYSKALAAAVAEAIH